MLKTSAKQNVVLKTLLCRRKWMGLLAPPMKCKCLTSYKVLLLGKENDLDIELKLEVTWSSWE